MVFAAVVFLAALGTAAYACMNHANEGKGPNVEQQSSDSGNAGACAGCPGSARMKDHMKQADSGKMDHDMQSGDHGMMRGNMSAPEGIQTESNQTR